MKQQVNLYQAPFKKEKVSFSTRTMLTGLGVALAGALMMSGYSAYRIYALQRIADGLDRQYAQALAQKEALAKRLAEHQPDTSLAERVKNLERLVAAQDRLKALVRDGVFQAGTGYSNYFIALARQHVQGMWLTGLAIRGAGQELVLQGETSEAELVPRYLLRLGTESVLSGLQFQVFHLTRPVAEKKGMPAQAIEFLVATSDPEGWL